MSNKSILQSNNDALSANNLDLQTLIDQANALPDAGGVELPELSNPATAAEVFANKELIDADGNKIVGTFTIENELTAQDDLISQIQAAVDSLPEASGGSDSDEKAEILTGTISLDPDADFIDMSRYIYYTDVDGMKHRYLENMEPTTINCVKGTIFHSEDFIVKSLCTGINTSDWNFGNITNIGNIYQNFVIIEENGFNIVLS